MSYRLKMARIESIHSLYQQGWSQRRIAQELRVNRETVARYLKDRLDPSKPANAPLGSLSEGDQAKPANAPLGSLSEGDVVKTRRCTPRLGQGIEPTTWEDRFPGLTSQTSRVAAILGELSSRPRLNSASRPSGSTRTSPLSTDSKVAISV